MNTQETLSFIFKETRIFNFGISAYTDCNIEPVVGRGVVAIGNSKQESISHRLFVAVVTLFIVNVSLYNILQCEGRNNGRPLCQFRGSF